MRQTEDMREKGALAWGSEGEGRGRLHEDVCIYGRGRHSSSRCAGGGQLARVWTSPFRASSITTSSPTEQARAADILDGCPGSGRKGGKGSPAVTG